MLPGLRSGLVDAASSGRSACMPRLLRPSNECRRASRPSWQLRSGQIALPSVFGTTWHLLQGSAPAVLGLQQFHTQGTCLGPGKPNVASSLSRLCITQIVELHVTQKPRAWSFKTVAHTLAVSSLVCKKFHSFQREVSGWNAGFAAASLEL